MIEAEFNALWYTACVNLFNSTHKSDFAAFHRLDELLGVSEFGEYTERIKKLDTPMPSALKRKVALLASPHWQVILKVNHLEGKLNDIKNKNCDGDQTQDHQEAC